MLLPIESSTLSTVQLYVSYRCGSTSELLCCIMNGWDREIVLTVQRVQSHVNSRVEMFLRAGEFIRNEEALNIRLATDETLGVDLRTHNCPRYNEVAAIVLDNVGAEGDMMLQSEVENWGELAIRSRRSIHYTSLCYSRMINEVGI